MTWLLSDSGTTSLTIGTETTLATDANNGTFVLEFDGSNLALGDLLESRIYTITLSGGSSVQMWKSSFQNVQISPHKASPPVAVDQQIKCTLNQIGGTINIKTITGTLPYGTLVTGQTTGATAVVLPQGNGVINSTSSNTATVVQMVSGAFNSSETVNDGGTANSFVMNGSPSGRSVAWKMLRV